jgi:hypothetical protein
MPERLIFHYTDADGHKAIASQVDWTFKPSQPPGDNEYGAYFTTLRPSDHRFSARSRIPKSKQQCVFAFRGDDGLEAKKGGKGAYILWTANDYVVIKARQVYDGPTENLP